MFHTVFEMISEGDYPDRIPKELVEKTLDFFSKEEDIPVAFNATLDKIKKNLQETRESYGMDVIPPESFL